ncbi:MAG: acetylglutamate kinase [Flavobacteriaceae bacterium]|nr:acetylglutamate kinase [Flavobacteriaceae bacterium]|tara:strand:- start:19179 stop:19961 length:783 start_codon:yes stop_codon:yes gene_type:complete
MDKSSLSIVKIGGNIIENKAELKAFLELFVQIPGKKILVHGGGKEATAMATKLGISSKMVDGRRITDSDSLKVITMVYAGLLNKNITASLQSLECNAIGISGADGNSITSIKRPVKTIDYGWVGDVTSVHNSNIQKLLESDFTPVFCAITHDGHGQLLNTNADTIAAELGKSLSDLYDVNIFYCFELPGVLRDISDSNSVITQLNSESYEELRKQNVISDGMLPKLTNCFDALKHGVQKVYIGNQSMFRQNETNFTTISL